MLLISLILIPLSLSGLSAALVARAALPPQFTVTPLGQQTSSFGNVSRDGGGGGNINGKNILLFCDTLTATGFATNTATYSNPDDPTQQTDFGINGNPQLAIPFTPAEQGFTNSAFNQNGTRTVIWPASSITYLGGTTGMFFVNVAQYNVYGTGTGNQYNTLVTVNAEDSGPSFTRTLEQAFYSDGPLWGSFGSTASYINGILFFANTEAGMKVAQVSPENYSDLSKYTYWNGRNWTSTPPSIDDTASAFIPGLNPTSGDIFWSSYYNTWMFVYMKTINVFSYRYALNGAFGITGSWSDEFELFDTTTATPVSGDIWDYAGHAYSGYDPTGQSIILSWSHGEMDEFMAKVQFK